MIKECKLLRDLKPMVGAWIIVSAVYGTLGMLKLTRNICIPSNIYYLYLMGNMLALGNNNCNDHAWRN